MEFSILNVHTFQKPIKNHFRLLKSVTVKLVPSREAVDVSVARKLRKFQVASPHISVAFSFLFRQSGNTLGKFYQPDSR